MRNILAIFFTVLIVGLMGYTFFQGKAFQGGEAGNIIEDIIENDKRGDIRKGR